MVVVGETSEVQMTKKKMVGWVWFHGWKFDGWMMCMCVCVCAWLGRYIGMSGCVNELWCCMKAVLDDDGCYCYYISITTVLDLT